MRGRLQVLGSIRSEISITDELEQERNSSLVLLIFSSSICNQKLNPRVQLYNKNEILHSLGKF